MRLGGWKTVSMVMRYVHKRNEIELSDLGFHTQVQSLQRPP